MRILIPLLGFLSLCERSAGEARLVGEASLSVTKKARGWRGVLSADDFIEVPHVVYIEYEEGDGSLGAELRRIGVCPHKCTSLEGLRKQVLHVVDLPNDMSVVVSDRVTGLRVVAWSRLVPEGSQPHAHLGLGGEKRAEPEGDDDDDAAGRHGGARDVARETARVLSHAAAMKMVQDAGLPWAVILEDISSNETVSAAPREAWGREEGSLARQVVKQLDDKEGAWEVLVLSHPCLRWPKQALELLAHHQQGRRTVALDPCDPATWALLGPQAWHAYAISRAGASRVLHNHFPQLAASLPPPTTTSPSHLPAEARVADFYLDAYIMDLRGSLTSLDLLHSALLGTRLAFLPTSPLLLLLTTGSGPIPSWATVLPSLYRATTPHQQPPSPLPPSPAPLSQATFILLGGGVAQFQGSALHDFPSVLGSCLSMCLSNANHTGLVLPCQLAIRTAVSSLHKLCLAGRRTTTTGSQPSSTATAMTAATAPRQAVVTQYGGRLLFMEYPRHANVSSEWQARLGCGERDEPPICRSKSLWFFLHGLSAMDATALLYDDEGEEVDQFMESAQVQHHDKDATSMPRRAYQVAAFWHVAQIGSWWERIVRDQARRLISSGLLPHLTGGLHVTLVGQASAARLFQAGGGAGSSSEDDESVFASVPSEEMPAEVKVVYGGDHWGVYEFPTLMELEAYCEQEPSARVLYMHVKGATVPVRHVPSFLPVTEWRQYMEYWLVTRFEDCLSAMEGDDSEGEEAFNSCGVELITEPKTGLPYYAGNFWWARCDLINQLPRLRTLNAANRWEAEFWLAKGYPDAWRPVSCYESNLDMYYERLPRHEYQGARGCRGRKRRETRERGAGGEGRKQRMSNASCKSEEGLMVGSAVKNIVVKPVSAGPTS